MRFKFPGSDNYSEGVTQVAPIITAYDDTVGLPKTFTVPEGEIWEICWAHIILVSSATVGNRNLLVVIKDEDGNQVFDFTVVVTQAASLTRHYTFQQGVYRESAFSGDDIQIPIPKDLFMTSGFTATISDVNDVDAAADQAKVSFQYKHLKGAL
jgi:hypothetical protein